MIGLGNRDRCGVTKNSNSNEQALVAGRRSFAQIIFGQRRKETRLVCSWSADKDAQRMTKD